jgi:hypothetical protein
MTTRGMNGRGDVFIGVTLGALLSLAASAALAQDNHQDAPPDSLQQGAPQQQPQAAQSDPPQQSTPEQQPQAAPSESPQQSTPGPRPQPAPSESPQRSSPQQQQHPQQRVPLPSRRRAPPPADELDDYTPRLMVAVYLGFATPVGSAADYYDTGFRVGMFIGWQLSLNLSLNLETTFDFLNPREAQDEHGDPMTMPSARTVTEFSFSPLVHAPIGLAHLDLVMGPKIGFFALIETRWMVGGNVGLLVVMGRTAVGGLFSYTAGKRSGADLEWLQAVSFDGVFLF